MKLIEQFDDFLDKVVNLNPDRIKTAEAGIETLTSFLTNHDSFGDLFIATSPQGSFKHRTIIKPPSEDFEFDVDLLFELEEVTEWDPEAYLNNLHQAFKGSKR